MKDKYEGNNFAAINPNLMLYKASGGHLRHLWTAHPIHDAPTLLSVDIFFILLAL